MRILVQILGLLLIIAGAFLWFGERRRSVAHSSLQPIKTAPIAAPPRTSKSQVRAAVVPAETQRASVGPTETPEIKPTSSSSPSPDESSTTRLFAAHSTHHEFEVMLRKKDGWYDTGIPVTPDLHLLMFCFDRFNNGTLCTRWVEAEVGEHIVDPPASSPGFQPLSVDVVSPDSGGQLSDSAKPCVCLLSICRGANHEDEHSGTN